MADNSTESKISVIKQQPIRSRFFVTDSKHVAEIWHDLKLSGSNALVETDEFVENVKSEEDVSKDELGCRTCGVTFATPEDRRSHFRDDWHRYNIKLKLRGKPPISEESFDSIEEDISSISGSESEEETRKPMIGNPKVFVRNSEEMQMAVYRSLLYSKKKPPQNDDELLQLLNQLPTWNNWAIIMLGGGHFAAAIYKGTDMISHKTFHSYTVRAKQGGSQSSRDNKSGGGSHPKSAGASLRRYNEASFTEHVHETMESWKSALKECHLIFYRAASSNQTILFGGKNPVFDRSDPRLRSVPFPTRRATLKEVQRVWQKLATIEIIEDTEAEMEEEMGNLTTEEPEEQIPTSDSELIDEINLKLPRRGKKKTKRKDENVNLGEEELGLFPGEKEMMQAIKQAIVQGNVTLFDKQVDNLTQVLEAYFEEYHLELSDVLNQRLDPECQTLLHIAAARKRAIIVWKLLELGCDPSLADALGRVPYVVAPDKETRNTFRRFMGQYDERYDYVKALIPSPLTEDIERQKQEKLAEKRKQQKMARKEKKQQEKLRLEQERKRDEEKRQIEEQQRLVEEEKMRFLNLSDREKRALAAERRLLGNLSAAGVPTPVLARCFYCAQDMSGHVPFEYNSNKFCTIQCLQKHRKENQNK